MKIDKSVFQAIAMVGQFGFAILTPTLLMFWAGFSLDRWLGTSYLAILFFFIGAIAGIRSVFTLVKRFDKPKDDDVSGTR
ncbi:MAG: AtpZ/AtpI family protein [Lachnospiraceae bacterium]|nr:AtpZ/AtpI family protein [Lachnospiraceae bacterium]